MTIADGAAELEPTATASWVWPLSPELFERMAEDGVVIRYGGHALLFRLQAGQLSKFVSYDAKITVDGHVVALMERYGDLEAGLLLPGRRNAAAIVVRSLDEVVQLVASTLPPR